MSPAPNPPCLMTGQEWPTHRDPHFLATSSAVAARCQWVAAGNKWSSRTGHRPG